MYYLKQCPTIILIVISLQVGQKFYSNRCVNISYSCESPDFIEDEAVETATEKIYTFAICQKIRICE